MTHLFRQIALLLLAGFAGAAVAGNVPGLVLPTGERKLPPSAGGPAARAGKAYDPLAGPYRLIAILIEFPADDNPATTGNGTFGDVPDANEAVFGEAFPEILEIEHDARYFREQLLYLEQYFRGVSYGNLFLETTLPETVFTAPEGMAYYGENEDAATWQSTLVRDAVRLADPVVDFSEYDGLVVYHAGVGEETDVLGDSPGDIWTAYLNRNDLAEALADSGREEFYRGIETDDTVDGDTFFVTEAVLLPESETQDEFNGTLLAQWVLGVAAHMTGRLLGAPSLFDTDSENGASQGIGSFGIMGTGLWNSGGILPPHPCAWTKLFFGWIDPLTVTRDTTLVLPPVEITGDDPRIVKVPLSEDEYFLIENRYKDENGNGSFDFNDVNGDNVLFPYEDSYEGAEFDWSLPAEGSLEGSGLMIWHVNERVIAGSGDFRTENRVNADAGRKGVDLEEADGIQDLDSPARTLDNFGSAGDSWRTGNAVLFGPATTPSTRTAFGAATGITIEVESEAGSLMTVSISFGPSTDGWTVLTEGRIALAGPVVPVRSEIEGIFGFAYAYYDSAAEEGFGNLLGHGGLPLDGWPVALSGTPAFAPVPFSAAPDAPLSVHFPMTDGSIVKIRSGGVVDTTAAWTEPVAGAEGNYLSAVLPAGPVFSLVPTGEETVVYLVDPSGGTRDSLAAVPGSAVGPAVVGPPLVITTDAGIVRHMDARNGDTIWESEVEGEIRNAVAARVEPETDGDEDDLFGTVRSAIFVAAGEKLHRFEGVTGEEPAGWPVRLSGAVTGPPALADIDRDGKVEILAGTDDGRLHLINTTGSPSAGWPLLIRAGTGTGHRDAPAGPPSVADFDGDGEWEVAFLTAGGSLWIVDRDGSTLLGFPVAAAGTNRFGAAAALDPAGDAVHLLLPGSGGSFGLCAGADGGEGIEWAGYGNGLGLRGWYAGSPFEPPGGETIFAGDELFCYPNPVLAGEGGIAKIHYRLLRPAAVSLRIYTAAGSVIHVVPPFQAPAETGEIEWDTRSVGSGVYYARIEAESAGREEAKFLPVAITR